MGYSQQMFNYEESFGKWGDREKKYRYISHEPLKVGDYIDVRNVKNPQIIKKVVTTEDKGIWNETIIHKLADGSIDYKEVGKRIKMYSNIVTL